MANEEHGGQHLTTELVDDVAGDPAARAAGERIEVGTLRLDVYVSRTAALFHVVDQLSEWDYFVHRQYARAYAPLSDVDRAMLAKHKAVRAKHGWGRGLEPTFYSPLSLDEALRQGVTQGRLSTEDAATEREVLLHFAPRIDTLFNSQAEGLQAFCERLRGELSARARLLQQFARFFERTPDAVSRHLKSNPTGIVAPFRNLTQGKGVGCDGTRQMGVSAADLRPVSDRGEGDQGTDPRRVL